MSEESIFLNPIYALLAPMECIDSVALYEIAEELGFLDEEKKEFENFCQGCESDSKICILCEWDDDLGQPDCFYQEWMSQIPEWPF